MTMLNIIDKIRVLHYTHEIKSLNANDFNDFYSVKNKKQHESAHNIMYKYLSILPFFHTDGNLNFYSCPTATVIFILI